MYRNLIHIVFPSILNVLCLFPFNELDVLLDEEEGDVDQPDSTTDTPPVTVQTPDPVPDTVPAVRTSVRIASRAGRGK